ncbi:peptidoglycan DD-metalloendopeptidase family protein [Gaiella sp.]|uniref:murein hydrolase activator EnvC family protein n=1 Tax=Gaiella sp. TaxID=2663207 RepID=UPI0032649BB2
MVRLSVVLGVLAAVMLLAGTATGDPGAEKSGVDARLGEAREKAEQAARSAKLLTTEVSRLSQAARSAEAALAGEQARVTALEASLAAEQARLTQLGREVDAQNARLAVLGQQYRAALRVLEKHVRAIYLSDSPDLISFAVGATSFGELINNLDLLDRIGKQDQRIAGAFDAARIELARARASTLRMEREVARSVSVIAARTAAQREARDLVASRRSALVAAESDKAQALEGAREDRATFIAEAEALAAQSAALAAKIQALQAAIPAATSPSPTAPSSGATLAWPVSGPVTSGFGPRWGRMHEGIDIAVGTGTPVGAAAAGTVIHAGWLGGYGNLVVIDHGGGLSTAYAHNSSLVVGEGTAVSAGTVVALSGNTGNSSGPHVHFEVRMNGAAVDPLRYL